MLCICEFGGYYNVFVVVMVSGSCSFISFVERFPGPRHRDLEYQVINMEAATTGSCRVEPGTAGESISRRKKLDHDEYTTEKL